MTPPGKAALFIDLAGVLLDDYPSPGQPAGLRAGAGAALRLLDRLDYRIVVLAPCALDRRQAARLPPARVADLLSRERVPMAGFCRCGGTVVPCADCPPAAALLQRAAHAYSVAMARSWLLARGAQHLLAGQRAGCRTLLIDADADADTDTDAEDDVRRASRAPAAGASAGTVAGAPPAWMARDIVDAALTIVRLDGAG